MHNRSQILCCAATTRVKEALEDLAKYTSRMKKIVVSEGAPKAIGPYSQAVIYNGLAYLSGQIPLDPATGQIVEGGIAVQAERVLENIKAVLDACGSSFDQVLKPPCT